MGTHFSKSRGHHCGVMSGHEVMAYTFVSGTQCQPKRRKFAKAGNHLAVEIAMAAATASAVDGRPMADGRQTADMIRMAVAPLSRSPSPVSLRLRKIQNMPAYHHQDIESERRLRLGSSAEDSESNASDKSDRQPLSNIEIDFSLEADSELESDSGISVNLSQFDQDTVSQAHVIQRPVLVLPPPPPSPPPPLDLTTALREQFEEEFCEWYEPGGKKKGYSRRKSSTRSLHQKLVVSKNCIKKATKLDMDDRAKMLQYFTTTNDETKSIQIEQLFWNSWRLPMLGPRMPTIITVQAPAGIGKSSMLKYMCLKWSSKELWTENFDVLIFIECRTLNHLGSLTSKDFMFKLLEAVHPKLDPELDLYAEICRLAACGRLLFLLDGLDEITDVSNLTNLSSRHSPDEVLSPIGLTQAILCGRLAPGGHVIVTSRPHTLTYLQSSKWFSSLAKKSMSLDIQGLSEEGVCAFIHSFVENKISTDDYEVACTELCPCRAMQRRAMSDRYIFSLASNPFYLWLLCTIFYEAGEGYVPRTLTQLYTWVILVFSNQWQGSKGKLRLDQETKSFLKGFAKLCYSLVQTGSIKMTATLDSTGDRLLFPSLSLALDLARAQTYGMMVVSKADTEVECEFRHLSLAEYLSALHIHITGDPLKGFAKDRKELILQYLSGLASSSQSSDQRVVENFLQALGGENMKRDPLFYLSIIQKMKGEWYNQEGLQKQMLFMRCVYESQVDQLTIFPFPGLKIINIRGNALLTLDLIIINHFVTRLQSDNQLLELSLRDQILEPSGLRAILPCLPLIRTVRLNGSQFDSLCVKRLVDVAGEVRANLRELYLHDICRRIEPEELAPLRNMCRLKGIKTNI